LDRPQEANIKFAESIPSWTASGLTIRLPNLKTLRTQTAALSGQLDVALLLVDEALEQIARPGWEERYLLAEALRAKGWILHRSDDWVQAEALPRGDQHRASTTSEILGASRYDQLRATHEAGESLA
jgi:hypothetical protein